MRNIEIWKFDNYVLYIEKEFLVAWHERTSANYVLDAMGNAEAFLGESCVFSYMGDVKYSLDTESKLYSVSTIDCMGNTKDIQVKARSTAHALGITLINAITSKYNISDDFYCASASEVKIDNNLLKLIDFYESVYPTTTIKAFNASKFEVNDTEHSFVYYSADELKEALAEDIKEAIIHDMINWGDITE